MHMLIFNGSWKLSYVKVRRVIKSSDSQLLYDHDKKVIVCRKGWENCVWSVSDKLYFSWQKGCLLLVGITVFDWELMYTRIKAAWRLLLPSVDTVYNCLSFFPSFMPSFMPSFLPSCPSCLSFPSCLSLSWTEGWGRGGASFPSCLSLTEGWGRGGAKGGYTKMITYVANYNIE